VDKPRIPTVLEPASWPEHDLVDEATRHRLDLADLDLSGRHADSVEFQQCRFTRTTLSGAALERASFTDCQVDHCDWANLRVVRSSLVRTEMTGSRFTGVQWIDGHLRHVRWRDCRLDLAAFRFTRFTEVEFVDSTLSRADFTHADLRGAHFVDCDLTAAQFAGANCAGTRFTRCDLAGLGSVASLAGAVLAGTDLTALARSLAGALGIVIDGS
jgi:uncharacterized protein YjbI with pentapeptide repeats